MTNNEWVKFIQKDLLPYNGKVSEIAKKIFIKQLKKNDNLVSQARALFGDRGVYYASSRDINRFINESFKLGEISQKGYDDYSKKQGGDRQ